MDAAAQPEPIFTGPFLRLSAASFLIFASFQGLMAVIAPFMLQHRMSVEAVGLSGAAFVLTAVAVRLPVGHLLDRYGRLGFLRVGLAVIGLVFAAYPWGTVLPVLVALRILHGVGWGLASTASATLVQDVVPPRRRGEATGYYANFGDLAMAFGPFLAVAALSHWGFAAFSWIAAAAMGLAILLLAKMPHTQRPPAHERPRSWVQRGAVLPSAIQFLMNINFGAVMTFLPVLAARRGLLHPVAGVDAYGFFYVGYAFTLLLFRGWLGRLSDTFGRFAVILPGLGVFAVAALFLSRLHTLPSLIAFSVLFGLGFGAAQPSVLAWTMERNPPAERGAAAGTYFAAFDLGIGVSALAFGPLAAISFRRVMEVAAAATVAAMALAAHAARTPRGAGPG
ncbi:MAG: MFS transporter [Firmicutes bacterium]|nr:MFS transporter [Alicyclobacillaceae bacterium]MCL6498077.1 MFS transporter [Bacillota bacterium]